jgi:hypothetical protein
MIRAWRSRGRKVEPPLGGLVDVSVDRDGAVAGPVLLGHRSLAVENRGSDPDGRVVGIEPPELLGGGKVAGLVELLLEEGRDAEH